MFGRISSVVLVAQLAIAIGLAGTGQAAEPQSPPLIPLGFEVAATNGFRAEIIAGQRPESTVGSAILILRRPGAAVTYGIPAEVTDTTIRASFGELGEIDVYSVPTGGKVTEHASCGGKPATFDAGRWEGTIRFRGEGGYSSVDASSGKATIRPFLEVLCFDERAEGIGGHSPGALLELHRRHAAETLELRVRKNKKVGPTRIGVELSERRGSLEIDRTVSAVDPSKVFGFEFPPGDATLEPPAPFSGSLNLTRRPGSSPLVRGNLEVDLPGRASVPILGPGTVRASLVRAVLDPSHPF